METKQVAKSSKKEEVKQPKAAGKKQQTVRERTQSSGSTRSKRIRNTARKASGPIKRLNIIGRPFRIFRRLVPGFIRNAWNEIKLVTWPDARQTWRLTMAVFIFSVIFAAIVGALDYVLGEIFREVIVGNE